MAELNGKYINEENHQKVKGVLNKSGKGLIIAGAILTAVAALLIIAGLATFIVSASNFSEPVLGMVLFIVGGFALVIGVPMLAIGVKLKLAAHAREIAAYGATTVLPVAKEAVEYTSEEIAPSFGKGLANIGKGIGDAAGSIAGGIARGIREAKKNLTCPSCGEKNVNDAKFCAKCGYEFTAQPQSKKTFCPNCGDECEDGQKFCEKCGHKLSD